MQQKTKCRQTTDRDKRVHTAFASSGFSVAAPQYGTHSRLALAPVLHHTHSVIFLKPTVSNRSLVPPSGLHECLRFGLWLTLRNIKDFTYLLTNVKCNNDYSAQNESLAATGQRREESEIGIRK